METKASNESDFEIKQLMNGLICKLEGKKRVAYIFNPQLLALVDQIPKFKGRASLVHQLITAYGLHEKMFCVKSEAASERELRLFHTEVYINYVKSINNEMTGDIDEQCATGNQFLNDELGLSYDCPPIPSLYDTICQIAGSTLTAIKAITHLQLDFAINWFGGWHHCRQSEAAGFCYVNDIVIAILYLLQLSDNDLHQLYRKLDAKEVLTIKSPLKNCANQHQESADADNDKVSDSPQVCKSPKGSKHVSENKYEFQDENSFLSDKDINSIASEIRVSPAKKPRKEEHKSTTNHMFNRILYIDLDLHHGDAVQDAFANTNRVFTLSFHKHEQGFYPGTGCISEIGAGRKGMYHTLNIPLKDGLNDQNFEYISTRVINAVFNSYKPNLILVQCGADTLNEDPMNSFNLTLESIAHCIQFIKSLKKPTIFLGGGGYNFTNTARLWTYLTSIIVDENINNDIPEHELFLEYKPSYELNIKSSLMKDKNNTREYLDQIFDTVQNNVKQIQSN